MRPSDTDPPVVISQTEFVTLIGDPRGRRFGFYHRTGELVGVAVFSHPARDCVLTNVFPYFTELKLKAPKFRVRQYKFVAKGIGYVDIEYMADHAITAFESKLPSRFRQKQNVSLDGQSTDQPLPSY